MSQNCIGDSSYNIVGGSINCSCKGELGRPIKIQNVNFIRASNFISRNLSYRHIQTYEMIHVQYMYEVIHHSNVLTTKKLETIVMFLSGWLVTCKVVYPRRME